MAEAKGQIALPFPLPAPRLSLEDFAVTNSNALAHAWIVQKTPLEWPSHCLVLSGPTGCGKSHLAAIWREKNKAVVVQPNEDVRDAHDLPAAILVEDAEKVAGIPAHEEWLFHLFNATKENRTPLLLTAKEAPAYWNLKLPDLFTRLKGSPLATLQQPDDDLLRFILSKQFHDLQMKIAPRVIDFLVAHMPRSGAVARTLVYALHAEVARTGHSASLGMVKDVLESTGGETLAPLIPPP